MTTAQEANDAALVRLAEIGALVNDSHVVYTSGKHGRAYVNIARAFNFADLVIWFAQQMAPLIEHLKFDTIIGPVNSDDKVGQAIVLELFQHHGLKAHPVYAQKLTRVVRPEGESEDVEAIVPGKFFLARQQSDFVTGQKVVIVGDVLTTGGTMDGVIETTREAGGIIVALLVACNRSPYKGTYNGYELIELMNVPMEQWDPPCQLCDVGVPINTAVGHGKKYLESQHAGTGS